MCRLASLNKSLLHILPTQDYYSLCKTTLNVCLFRMLTFVTIIINPALNQEVHLIPNFQTLHNGKKGRINILFRLLPTTRNFWFRYNIISILLYFAPPLIDLRPMNTPYLNFQFHNCGGLLTCGVISLQGIIPTVLCYPQLNLT